MRRLRNDRLIRRNSLLGRGLLFGGLGILAAGFLVSLSMPGVVLPFLIVAVTGMLTSQLGIAWMSRWGRGPRLDERIDVGLKGLDDQYAIIHYGLGAPHALVAPSGVYALVPVVEDGTLREASGRWTRTVPRRGLLRPARTESMGDLAGRGRREAAALARSLSATSPSLPVRPVLVFLNSAAEVVAAAEAEPSAVHIKKLKDWLRRQTRSEAGKSVDLGAIAARLKIAPQKE